jgi:hypothetical protein
MSRPSARSAALLELLGEEPQTTGDLYDRMGYATLVRIGLVPYDAFRAALAELERDGLATSETSEEGPTWWRRAAPPA